MPKRAHRHHVHRKVNTSEEGFIAESSPKRELISNEFKKSMNKNEKIIMGILVAGIVCFLALSVIVLFSKSKENRGENFTPISTLVPTKAPVTPYPSVPPITDFTMQVNEHRFYPDTVGITKGHTVTIINIGQSDTVIEPIGPEGTLLFGTILKGEEKSVKFDQAGVYRYTRKSTPGQTLTITVR